MRREDISDFVLERYIQGGLSLWEKFQIKRWIKKDQNLRKSVEDIKASDTDFKLRFPSSVSVPEIVRKHALNNWETEQLPVRKGKIRWVLTLKFAISAIAVSGLLLFIPSPPSESSENINIIKGESRGTHPHLLVHRKEAQGIERLKSGTKASAGDLLQLSLFAPEETYGAIISIDGNRTVTLHYPFKDNRSTKLQKGIYTIPRAIELDDAPDFEKFYLITSESEIDVKTLLESVKRSIKKANTNETVILRLSSEYRQFNFNIIKENSND